MSEPIDVTPVKITPVKKAVRIFFDTAGQHFAVDRLCDPAKNDQENCNDAIDLFMKQMNDGASLPVIQFNEDQTQFKQVFMNMKNMFITELVKVGTYEVKVDKT